jgi:HD-GYP domain-containing protein (c-di-GMP phosphodiesterase class II)
MGVSQQQIQVHDLQQGMFVSKLDRPWHLTPFPIQGFYIRSQKDIQALASHCRWVTIDVLEAREAISQEKSGRGIFARSANPAEREKTLELPPLQVKNAIQYQQTTTMKKELKFSAQLMLDIEAARTGVIDSITAGQFPDIRPLARISRQMASSVIRNPNAMLWLARIKNHDDYTYQHSLNTSVWALVCGRHLGLQEELLGYLAMGCLLANLGKASLPAEILANEDRLDAQDFERYKSYVEKGASKLEGAGMSRAVVTTVRGHRERHNGSGFPLGVCGDRIPLLAKIAGLVDYYETLIAPRPGHKPFSPADAVSRLYEQRNILFQADLIERFIQAVGIYPTGTLVSLSNGQRGMVVSQTASRKLWPRVMIMTDEQNRPLRASKVVNLAEYNEGKPAEETLRIDVCLPFGTDNLDPGHYDVTGGESRWSLKKLIGA